MAATLPEGASNTHYGQWPGEKAAVCGPEIAGHWPHGKRRDREIRRH